jgi:hypothetical protein
MASDPALRAIGYFGNVGFDPRIGLPVRLIRLGRRITRVRVPAVSERKNGGWFRLAPWEPAPAAHAPCVRAPRATCGLNTFAGAVYIGATLVRPPGIHQDCSRGGQVERKCTPSCGTRSWQFLKK